MVEDSRQSSAIEITPQMIDAGVLELSSWLETGGFVASDSWYQQVLVSVFSSMVGVDADCDKDRMHN